MFQGDLHFAKTFGKPNKCAEERILRGVQMLTTLAGGNQFCVADMLGILRDKDSNICRGRDHSHPTASSQVTNLTKLKRKILHLFWSPLEAHPFFAMLIALQKIYHCNSN